MIAALVILLWSYPPGYNVAFNVYEQTVVPTVPYWFTNITGRIAMKCDIVTTDWLTNGWQKIGQTAKTNYFIAPKTDGLLHAFIVKAVDLDTGIESGPATK